MLCGLLGATPQFRDFIVAYPVSFSLRYLYIRPISRTSVVCSFVRSSVCRSQVSLQYCTHSSYQTVPLLSSNSSWSQAPCCTALYPHLLLAAISVAMTRLSGHLQYFTVIKDMTHFTAQGSSASYVPYIKRHTASYPLTYLQLHLRATTSPKSLDVIPPLSKPTRHQRTLPTTPYLKVFSILHPFSFTIYFRHTLMT